MARKRRGGRGRQPLKIEPGFGEAVHELMLLKRNDRRPWRVKDLADALGVSVDTVRRWIGGKLPFAKQILPLARKLGVSCDDLLLAHETGDISHISALPEQIRVSGEERVSALHERPQKLDDGLSESR